MVRKKFRAFFQGILVVSLAALLQARALSQEITVRYQQSRRVPHVSRRLRDVGIRTRIPARRGILPTTDD